ncbi:DUF2064 domain-containing protein [soil metagenome]
MTILVLIAKETIPGRVKTRLHPALTFDQAAELAAASIDDTISALAEVPAARRILLFDGMRVPASAAGWQVVQQVGGPLDERLAAIFDALDEPVVLVGMDTPQLTAADLAPAFDSWAVAGAAGYPDAWFGPACDGGFWALGMREPRGELVRGIPMSRPDTGKLQLDRLARAGLSVGMLPPLTDVDTIADAHAVAALAPSGAFATTLASFAGELVSR